MLNDVGAACTRAHKPEKAKNACTLVHAAHLRIYLFAVALKKRRMCVCDFGTNYKFMYDNCNRGSSGLVVRALTIEEGRSSLKELPSRYAQYRLKNMLHFRRKFFVTSKK